MCSFTWFSRTKLRSCNEYAEPLWNLTRTVNFWPGEIAARGSCPGCACPPDVWGETRTACRERFRARLRAVLACCSFSCKRTSKSCFWPPFLGSSSRRESVSITESRGAAALLGSLSTSFVASATLLAMFARSRTPAGANPDANPCKLVSMPSKKSFS